MFDALQLCSLVCFSVRGFKDSSVFFQLCFGHWFCMLWTANPWGFQADEARELPEEEAAQVNKNYQTFSCFLGSQGGEGR